MTPDEIKLLKPLERIATALESVNKRLDKLALSIQLAWREPTRLTVMHERDLLATLAAQLYSHEAGHSCWSAVVRDAQSILDEVEIARQDSVKEVSA